MTPKRRTIFNNRKSVYTLFPLIVWQRCFIDDLPTYIWNKALAITRMGHNAGQPGNHRMKNWNPSENYGIIIMISLKIPFYLYKLDFTSFTPVLMGNCLIFRTSFSFFGVLIKTAIRRTLKIGRTINNRLNYWKQH